MSAADVLLSVTTLSFDIAGLEIHATVLLNLLRGDWLTRESLPSETWFIICVGLLAGGLGLYRPLPAAAIAISAWESLGESAAGFFAQISNDKPEPLVDGKLLEDVLTTHRVVNES